MVSGIGRAAPVCMTICDEFSVSCNHSTSTRTMAKSKNHTVRIGRRHQGHLLWHFAARAQRATHILSGRRRWVCGVQANNQSYKAHRNGACARAGGWERTWKS
jgi:hypothetical protein